MFLKFHNAAVHHIANLIPNKEKRRRFRTHYKLRYDDTPFSEYYKSYTHSFPKYTKPQVSFKHSGKIGDVIYSLPIIKALSERFGSGNANLFIEIGDRYDSIAVPFLKEPMMNERSFKALEPLLSNQDYIKETAIYSGQIIDFDLCQFRKKILYLDRGDITKWYQYLLPVSYDTSKPWIKSDKDPVAQDAIVVSRTARCNAPGINYGFLKNYPLVYFVGTAEEFTAIKESIQKIEWLKTENFHDLAKIIAGAKLFIGNQSSPFAVAEALKVPRLMELFMPYPNVIPSGKSCAVFCVQSCFEQLVKDFWEGIHE